MDSEWLNLTAFLGTADNEVHIVHISRVITAYTLESLSSLTQITHNLQATINFKKKGIKKNNKKVRAPIQLTNHWRKRLWISLHNESELILWWSLIFADGAHHKKPHSPTHPINYLDNFDHKT